MAQATQPERHFPHAHELAPDALDQQVHRRFAFALGGLMVIAVAAVMAFFFTVR